MSMSGILGSLGSKTGGLMSKFGNSFSKGMTAAVSTVSDTVSSINEEFFNDGEEHYFEEDRSESEVREILNRGSGRNREDDKIVVMKWMIAQLSKGVDMSAFFPDVVKLVICPSVELKHYVYLYLIHYCDYNESCRENALLSVNTFQQDMSGKNPRIRALALRVMTSIRVPEIWQLQLMAVQKCVVDSVPFVRKIAAHALLKLYQWDPTQEESIIKILKTLLRETNTLVFSSAIIAFNEICPTRYDLLHSCYRKMLSNLPNLEEPAQVVCLTVLMKYARTQFIQPTEEDMKKMDVAPVVKQPVVSKKAVTKKVMNKRLDDFYGSDNESESYSYSDYSEEEKEEVKEEKKEEVKEEKKEEVKEESSQGMDEDLCDLFSVAENMLSSINPAVVVAAASLLLYTAPGTSSYVTKSLDTLIHLLNRDHRVSYIVLNSIDELSALYLQFFLPYIHSFYPRISEPEYIISLKTRILCRLLTEDNVDDVMKALQPFALHPSSTVIVTLINTLLRISQQNKESSRLCLHVIIQITDQRISDSAIGHAAIMAIDRLLDVLKEEKEKKEVLVYFIKRIMDSNNKVLFDSLLLLLLHHCSLVLTETEEVIRLIVKQYMEIEKSTRLVLLQLLVKVSLLDKENPRVKKMLDYVLELNSRDIDVEVRVQARNIKALYYAGHKDIENVLVKVLDSENRQNEYMIECHLDSFYVGSLSLLINETFTGYTPIPDWTDTPVPGEFRDPVKIEERERAEEERKEKERKAKERAERKAADAEYSDYSYSEDEPKKEKKEKPKKEEQKEEYSDYSYSYSDYSYSEDEKEVEKEKPKKEEKKEEKKEVKEEKSKEEKEEYSDYSYSEDEKKDTKKETTKEDYSEYSDYSYSDVLYVC